ncbi:MAG TPA: ferritin-like domain-containing protein [Gammaproteobacteria bacterium]|nr:ferritin-like domain-containing protein [Gammaproteobacteria bacterium]
MPELFQRLEVALLETEPTAKCGSAARLYLDWRKGDLAVHGRSPILPIDDAGRPEDPMLVDPRQLERRSVATESGRIKLLHAFAHIEFNAINIALDAAYRFRQMPSQYIDDWLRIASEEASHFQLLEQTLRERGSHYGAYPAHRGLWDMVCNTRHDALHRMAMVPRVMEARGLDVTPMMIKKFHQAGDTAAVAILEQIYRDEIDHVRIGNHWYQLLCDQQGLDAGTTFRALIDRYMGGKLRGPFNWPARIEAGFKAAELNALEQGLQSFRGNRSKS